MYHQQGTTLTVCIPYRIVQLDDFISNHQLQQQLTSLSVLPKWKTTSTLAVPSKTKASSTSDSGGDCGCATRDECTPTQEKQQVIDYLRNTLPKQSRSFTSYAIATALIEVVENDPNQKHKTSKKRRKGDQDKNDDSHANHADTTEQEPTTGPCSGLVDSKDNPKEPERRQQQRDPCSWFLSDEEQDWLTEAWTIIQSRISWQSWLQLYHRIRKTLVLWSPSLSGGGNSSLQQLLQHPDTLLLWYAQRILPTLTHKELLQAQVVLQKPLDLLATTPTSRTKNERNDDNADDPSPSSSTPQARCHALLFWNLYQTIHQKCLPPVYAILLESPHHDHDDEDVNQPSTSSSSSSGGGGCVCAEHETCLSNAIWEYNHTKERMELVALYDLDQDEKWHVSYTGAPSENWQQRQTSLKERYGPQFVCHCVWCKLDEQQQQQGNSNSNTILPPPDTLVRNVVRLGHVAMANQQYNRALLLYRHALERDPSQLSVWHAIGAVLLAQRKFLQAQRHWNQALLASASTTTTSDPAAAAAAATLEDYQKTKGVAVQLEKLQAYRYLHPINLKTDGSSSSLSSGTISHCGGRCFVTRDPIVSEQTCRMILEWVATADDCWTTSRHYAVPTHDVPVHQIPQLLNWFLDWFHHTVHPLLEQQFLVDKKKKSGRFYVHDAFVVRYQAQGGGSSSSCPYLPIHVDESTHSFVLTLNDHENFTGGGTYFCDWDCLVSPTKPGVLVSFRGDSLRHGGNPVTRGERYILAGFLYYDDDDDDNSVIFPRNEKKKKKRLFPSCSDDEKRSSPKRFSFNFPV